MNEEVKKSKQIICIRKDLNMRRGKQIAQGSHASLKAILDLMEDVKYADNTYDKILSIHNPARKEGCEEKVNGALRDWLDGLFTKICVSVNSEEELLEIYNKAKNKGLICSLITDAGLTEFGGVPTITCCAIGPAWSEDVDEITGKLSLL